MTEKLTELVFVIDRSGSMGGLESDTIGGFNSMIEKQKAAEGKAVVTTVLFSNDFQFLHERTDLNEVKKMTEKEYYVTASTALLDAVGGTIDRIKRLQKENPPDATLFVIITDGMENASREYTYSRVKKMIEEQKKDKWDFLFLGANIDVVEEARMIGIRESCAISYECDPIGVKMMYQKANEKVLRARETGTFEKRSYRGKKLDLEI